MNRRPSFRILATAVVCTWAIVNGTHAAPSDGGTLVQALQEHGVKSGIIVQWGCPDVQDGLDVLAAGDYVIQALEPDREQVAAARQRILSAECGGRLTVRHFPESKLPYVDNLVNAVVVSNPQDVSLTEMLRVVRPLGAVLIRNGEAWQGIVKPWPEAIDEWTHFLHSANGNAVSQDRLIGPPRRLQWSAGAMWGRSHEMNNSFPALVTARGRVFYIFDQGLTGMEDPRLPERWTLFARDAFNGTLLWQRPLTSWSSAVWQTRALRFFKGGMARRLVVDGDRLYVTFEYGGEVQILDAATGETLGEIPGTEGAEEILVQAGQVFVGSQLPGERRGQAAARITCFDADNGTLRWQVTDKALLPQLMTVGVDHVVYHNGQEVVCLERNDGSVRWKYDDSSQKSSRGEPMLLLADDKIILSSRRQIIALAASDGRPVWQAPGAEGQSMREYDLFFARGTIWCSGPNGTILGYDIRDGKAAATLDASGVQSPGHHLRCYRAKATEDFLITQFRGVEFVSLDDQGHSQNDWLRGTCTYGVMPANGFLYVPPHSCLCYSAAMFRGLNAFSGDRVKSPEAAVTELAAGPLEPGPAYDVSGSPVAASDPSWVTYRHDARRTGASSSQVPGTLDRRWKTKIDADLTPPVAADGRVFVASKEHHSIHALDGSRGDRLWTFLSDGRIDSPPSIVGNRLLFGSADGFLYCVQADDGQLAWRRRLAPAERWMAVDGQLESVYRLHGSVLIEGGLAYCCAGRSSYLDGGLFLYAVDIETGEIRHRGRLDTRSDTRVDAADDEFVSAYHIEGAHSDILVAEGGFIFLNQFKFSPDLKLQPAKYLSKAEITARPSMNLDDQDFVNEEIFDVQWRGKRWGTYDELAGILVDENQNVGERDLGLHLFTTSGFLDTSFFNRTYWMYSKTWTGFNHANLAPKSGQMVVIGPENTYALKAYTSRYALSPKLDPETKGYQLIVDRNENEPTMDPRAWGKDKGMGFSRGAPPVWNRWLPVRVRAMVLGGETLVVCGPPDQLKGGDPMAAFEGRLGSELWSLSAADGQVLSRQHLAESPIFDGLIVADERLYLCTEQGDVLCLADAPAD